MKNQWIGKNVNLELLANLIKGFFESKGFSAKIERSNNEFIVLGLVSHNDKKRRVTVKIFGSPNDFFVELLETRDARFQSLFGPVVTLFGGGAIILKDLKSREFYEKVEDEILAFVEETIANLSGFSKAP